jgi:hypothetical protein
VSLKETTTGNERFRRGRSASGNSGTDGTFTSFRHAVQPSRFETDQNYCESRRVHSPICGEDLYRGENAEIISPSNLTLVPPPRILKLTESCTTFLMTPDIRGHLRLSPARQILPLRSSPGVLTAESTLAEIAVLVPVGRGPAPLIGRPIFSCPAQPSLHWTTGPKRCQNIAQYLRLIVFPFLVRLNRQQA